MYNVILNAAIEGSAAMVTTLPDQHSLRNSRRGMPLRSLGEYLTELGVCSNENIANALENRPDQSINSEDEHLAASLLESRTISRQDLEKARQLQDTDLLGTMSMFRSLPRKILINLVQQSAVLEYSPWDIIFKQGEASRSACVILSGIVNLAYKPTTGPEINIAIRSSGEVCGEMSLLVDSRRFATARAVIKSRILAVPKDLFLKLFQANPVMFKDAVKRWYWAIVDSRMQTQAFLDQYYSELLSSLSEFSCSQLHGYSRQAVELRDSLSALTGSENPILLLGEKGTLKTRIAQYVYENSNARNGPFIIFDPSSLPSFITEKFSSASPEIPVEKVQHIALFGEMQQTSTGSEVPWQGFLAVANNGMLVINNCHLLHPEVQRQLSAYIKTGSFLKTSKDTPFHTTARLVLAAEEDYELAAELYSTLAKRIISLPTLRNRKKDLKGLVVSIVDEISRLRNKLVPAIDQEAVNKIMAYDWPGNFKELEDVLQRAVSLKKTDRLTAEDIFIGKVPITGKNAYNLLRLPLIGKLFQNPLYPRAFQIPIAIMFLFVIALGIWGNPSSESNISLLLIWANWEPLLIISCLLLARIWCSFCPVGVIAEQFRKIPKFRKRIQARKLKNFFYLSAAGLAIVFWSQSALSMWERPRETAGLLLAMLVSAILFALFFEGRIWCRYVCPLGQMVATFARLSIVEVRSNYNYCNNECSTYDCSTGKDNVPGCRMAKGPFVIETNQNCIICGDCIKNCPHQSVRLNLRVPGWELWNAKTTDLAVLLFVPLLWGTQIFRGLNNTSLPQYLTHYLWSSGLVYGLIMAFSIVFAFHVAIAGIAFMGKIDTSAGTDYGSVFVLSILPLIYAIEIAIRLVPLLNHAADFFRVLSNQIGYTLPQVAFRLDMQSIHFLQVIIITAGLLFSLTVSNKQTQMFAPDQVAPAFFRFLPIFTIAVVSITLL
jgi:transcriptional regulator with AAA-type ATPase domain/polyferredoxin